MDGNPATLTAGYQPELGADGAGYTARDVEADGGHGGAAGDAQATRGERHGPDAADDGEDDGRKVMRREAVNPPLRESVGLWPRPGGLSIQAVRRMREASFLFHPRRVGGGAFLFILSRHTTETIRTS